MSRKSRRLESCCHQSMKRKRRRAIRQRFPSRRKSRRPNLRNHSAKETAMQNIYDMTTSEVAALTEEEIKSFIDIECASKGVMLLPPEPMKPVQPEIKQDVTMYEFMGTHFASSE